MAEPDVFGRGFQPAIDFFRAKVNLPTRTWRDLRHGMHTRAFTVAGAMKADLLSDLRRELQRHFDEGLPYDDFKRRFKEITRAHNWQYNGSPGWRSRVIWHTNVRVAASVGRYEQMRDEKIVGHMKWWMYDHTTINNPREQHKAWDGMVLRHDDPWWDVNWPPNGWGCNCRVIPMSDRMLKQRGITPTENPPDTSGLVPEEWRYNPGIAAHGVTRSRDKGVKPGNRGWSDMGQLGWKDWKQAELPKTYALRELSAKPFDNVNSQAEIQGLLTQLVGGSETVAALRTNGGFELPVRISVSELMRHIDKDPARWPFSGLLLEALQSPDEVWLTFEQSQSSHKVQMRAQVFRRVSERHVLRIVLNANDGAMETWTMYPVSKHKDVNKRRHGTLLYARDGE